MKLKFPEIKKKIFEDIKGKKFGSLTAIKLIEKEKDGFLWEFKCDCGAKVVMYDGMIKCGVVKDCGCGESNPKNIEISEWEINARKKLYKKYLSMKERCCNKRSEIYKRYGGRGIKICKEWLDSFDDFYNWAIGNGWVDGKSIDRINNKKGYSPSNCRWATKQEQERNKTSNVHVEFRGETKLLIEWCEILGLKYYKTYRRIKYFKWGAEKAFAP